MTLRPFAMLGLVLACFSAASLAHPRTTLGATRKATTFINGVPDTGQFLPDSFVICRVGPRATTVGKYIDDYFYSYAVDRPAPDSLGRVQFLNTLINRDLLGLVAREINPPMRFEDRTAMRENQQRVLSEVLYRRVVKDSVVVTDADLAREYETYRYNVRLRHILFGDRATAERVRLDLVRGRIPWKQAYEKYSLSRGKDRGPEGELGWLARGSVDLYTGRMVFMLAPGSISDLVETADGFNLVQVLERREATPPSLEAVRSVIRDGLVEERSAMYSNRVRDVVRSQIGMTYDSTTIAWAAAHFIEVRKTINTPGGASELNIDTSLPEFAPADTARVLARYRDGVFTLGRFFAMYSEIQPLMRTSVNTPDQFRAQVDGFVFEPYMAQVAIERGIDKDPEAIAKIEQKREQIMIDRVYQDSVMAHVSVGSKARRKYYDEHKSAFVTYARVRFATMWAHGRPAADSLAARLRGGEKAVDILRADSLIGVARGSIQERAENEHGPAQKLLLEQLKPGEVSVEGPNREGDYFVYQSLEYIPGRQLSFEDASAMIDESLQNVEAERLLNGLIERHRKAYPVESHPELVMQIRLLAPEAQ